MKYSRLLCVIVISLLISGAFPIVARGESYKELPADLQAMASESLRNIIAQSLADKGNIPNVPEWLEDDVHRSILGDRDLKDMLKYILESKDLKYMIGNAVLHWTEWKDVAGLVALESGTYMILSDGKSFWRPDGKQDLELLAPHLLANNLVTDGEVVYAGSSHGVWRLDTPEKGWEQIGSGCREMAVSRDSGTVYVWVDDSIEYLKKGETGWQSLTAVLSSESDLDEDSESFQEILALGPGQVYMLVEGQQFVADHIAIWDEENGYMSYMDEDDLRRIGGVNTLKVGRDGRTVWVQSPDGGVYWRTAGRSWGALSINDPDPPEVNDLLVDPYESGVLYAGTKEGLYWTSDDGETWNLALGSGTRSRSEVKSIVYHPRWRVPLVVMNTDVGFVALLREDPNTGCLSMLKTLYSEYHKATWFWPITVLGSFFSAYVLSMAALLLLAWRGGSRIFSRMWLISIAAKPLLKAPGLGRWALFLGYKRRLVRIRGVDKASKDYFGLPAEGVSGEAILPDPTGESLHKHIAEVLGPQQPVLVIGKGGAGKSTLLARLVHLALKRQLPSSLRGFRPLLIPAVYYEESLTKAIGNTLRERDGVAVDDKMMEAQLQTGKFLVLFDGVTEIQRDKQQGLQEILRTAKNADFRNCRFLISTRPLDYTPAGVPAFQLQPLNAEVISDLLLPRYGLGRERENQVSQQLQSFGKKPIEPLIFFMAIGQSRAEQISANKSQLYQRYFRRSLGVETNDTFWLGWETSLGKLAQWFFLDTGNRGVGLPHKRLVDLIAGKADDNQGSEKLIEALQRRFHLPVKDELDMLQQLEAAGLLQGGRRWRFAHDTFEEYFAASRVLSYLEDEEQWQIFDKWTGSRGSEREFIDVLDFLRERLDETTRQQILALPLPDKWRDYLEHETEGGVEGDQETFFEEDENP